MKIYYPKLTVLHLVEYIFFVFFNNFFIIKIMNQIITTHKAIYSLFGSVIYHKRLSPAQAFSFALILWYVSKTIYFVSVYLLAHVSQLLDHVSQLLARVNRFLACARVKTVDVGPFPLLIV